MAGFGSPCVHRADADAVTVGPWLMRRVTKGSTVATAAHGDHLPRTGCLPACPWRRSLLPTTIRLLRWARAARNSRRRRRGRWVPPPPERAHYHPAPVSGFGRKKARHAKPARVADGFMTRAIRRHRACVVCTGKWSAPPMLGLPTRFFLGLVLGAGRGVCFALFVSVLVCVGRTDGRTYEWCC